MNPLEKELKKALHRQEPGQDFAAKVLARLAREKSVGVAAEISPIRYFSRFFSMRHPLARWAAAGAMATALIAGGLDYKQVQQQKAREHASGEAAKERLVLALRIAGRKLQIAKTKVNQINAN